MAWPDLSGHGDASVDADAESAFGVWACVCAVKVCRWSHGIAIGKTLVAQKATEAQATEEELRYRTGR